MISPCEDKFIYHDYSELANSILADCKQKKTVYTILFFDEAVQLIKELLKNEEISIGYLEIQDSYYNGYNMEYYVIVDDELSLCVEEALASDEYHKNKYLSFYADRVYIDGRACSRIVTDNEISDYIEIEHNSVDNTDEVLEFINRRFPGDSSWLNGNCYYFALILKDRFPDGEIFYDVIDGHFVFEYNDNLYDYSGITAQDGGYLVQWSIFDKYDSLQKSRIIRDCIL